MTHLSTAANVLGISRTCQQSSGADFIKNDLKDELDVHWETHKLKRSASGNDCRRDALQPNGHGLTFEWRGGQFHTFRSINSSTVG